MHTGAVVQVGQAPGHFLEPVRELAGEVLSLTAM